MREPIEAWLYVRSTDGHISLHDTQHAAENAAIDDPGNPWIELVTLDGPETAPEAPYSHEPPTSAGGEGPNALRAAQARLHGTAHFNPWRNDDDAA